MPVTPETYAVILMALWGACVGSFLNVVVFRVPEGLSVVSPPSRCPGCEKKLAWYDNVPILGWLWLRGKCRNCKMKISVQYPLVEAFTAIAFAGLTWAYYFTDLRPVFSEAGLLATWPVLGVHLTLLACMIAATLIDAKLYIIPLGIVWTASLVAFLQPVLFQVPNPNAFRLDDPIYLLSMESLPTGNHWAALVPVASGVEAFLALGGMAGLCVSLFLLHHGWLPQSFSEEIELPEGLDADDPNSILVHPHPRRETLKELLFLFPVFVGAGSAWLVLQPMAEDFAVLRLDPLAGVLLGYLVGGGVVWAIRIFGTLLFGKEAMGLGDVHLMAAVGAVIGWRDATLAFFIAPFIGIGVVIVTAGVGAVLKGRTRVIPYGPSLCAATLVVMLFRNEIWAYLLPQIG
ncbi:MAG: prepilin peptidase [Planctomycetota bacterium]